MSTRRRLLDLLSAEPRSVSRLVRELGLERNEIEEHLRHAIRSARAVGYRVVVLPARCRGCGFLFNEDKLSKPGRCPECRSSRIFEAQVRVE